MSDQIKITGQRAQVNYFFSSECGNSNAKESRKNCYEEFLIKNNIKHRLIPPGEKELNGLVERCHRADDEEFYHRVRPADLKEFNKLLKEHCLWRNENRRKKPLGWMTTFEFLHLKTKGFID